MRISGYPSLETFTGLFMSRTGTGLGEMQMCSCFFIFREGVEKPVIFVFLFFDGCGDGVVRPLFLLFVDCGEGHVCFFFFDFLCDDGD